MRTKKEFMSCVNKHRGFFHRNKLKNLVDRAGVYNISNLEKRFSCKVEYLNNGFYRIRFLKRDQKIVVESGRARSVSGRFMAEVREGRMYISNSYFKLKEVISDALGYANNYFVIV